MKSVSISDVKKFEIKEIVEPKKEFGKVLIEVKKSGICGSDIHYWEIGNPIGLIMGHEFSGVVIDPGDREDLKIGDRVTALPISPCGHCEACVKGNIHFCKETWTNAVGLSLNNPGALTKIINVRSDMVLKLPDTITYEEAVLVEPIAVSYHASNLANVNVGDNVLVVGGGIIGLLSAMFAKKSGASKVVVSETNDKRGNKALELGVADEWLDAKNESEMQRYSEQFDVVIECCGNSPAVNSSMNLVKSGGRVILVGVSIKPIEFISSYAVMKELNLIGAIAYTKEEFSKCIDLIANKEIEVQKFISKEISLDEVPLAYEDLYSGNSENIKVLIDLDK